MGIYTHFVINVNLRKNTPQEVIDTLLYLSSQSLYNPINENHQLYYMYGEEKLIFTGHSGVFDGDSYCLFFFDEVQEEWKLTINSSMKNYDREYQKFLDYIQPYIAMEFEEHQKFLGFMRDETQDAPTLIYNTRNGIDYKESEV